MFEEMFLTGFFTNGLVIFNPFSTNPTYRYIAYKDAKEGNPVHALIKKVKDAKQAEWLRMALATAYFCHQQLKRDH